MAEGGGSSGVGTVEGGGALGVGAEDIVAAGGRRAASMQLSGQQRTSALQAWSWQGGRAAVWRLWVSAVGVRFFFNKIDRGRPIYRLGSLCCVVI